MCYIGYVKDIEDGYCVVDYMIFVLKYELFGLVGIELVMCGMFVILLFMFGCYDVIVDYVKLMFVVDDVEVLCVVLVMVV